MPLILIRHAAPQSDSTIPASDWRLSHAGRESCRDLAEQLKAYNLDLLVSSIEAKAVETARLTAQHLDIPSEIAFGLHEHDRANLGFIPSGERFEQLIADLFARPDEVVFGRESANQALSRFEGSLALLREQYPEKTLGVVSHGTVISLLVAAHNSLDGFAFWQDLEMPHIVALDDDFRLQEGQDGL
jgi:broad specificity phosphatase PhoE